MNSHRKRLPKKNIDASGSPDYPEFHKSVKVILAQRGISMSALADFLGYSRQNLHTHLMQPRPNIIIILVLSEFLNVEPGMLVGDLNFKVPTRIIGYNWWWDFFDQRFELYMKRAGVTWADLSEKLNMPIDAIKQKIAETKELAPIAQGVNKDSDNEESEKIDLFLNDHHGFFIRLLGLVNTNPERFFYLLPKVREIKTKLVEAIIDTSEPELEPITEMFENFQADLNFRVNLVRNIVDYFVENYPNDKLSRFLITHSWDTIPQNSQTHNYLRLLLVSDRNQEK